MPSSDNWKSILTRCPVPHQNHTFPWWWISISFWKSLPLEAIILVVCLNYFSVSIQFGGVRGGKGRVNQQTSSNPHLAVFLLLRKWSHILCAEVIQKCELLPRHLFTQSLREVMFVCAQSLSNYLTLEGRWQIFQPWSYRDKSSSPAKPSLPPWCAWEHTRQSSPSLVAASNTMNFCHAVQLRWKSDLKAPFELFPFHSG